MMVSDKPAFQWVHQIMKETGTDIACIKLGGVHVIPITCPKIALEVLKNQDANFASRPLTLASKTFSRGYRDTVMSPYGDQWKKMRLRDHLPVPSQVAPRQACRRGRQPHPLRLQPHESGGVRRR
jgi:hypothetical protein